MLSITIFEWLSIVSSVLVFIFGFGMIFEKFKTGNSKTDKHEDTINKLSTKVDSITTKMNLIEAENKTNSDNIHKMRNELNIYKQDTVSNFHKQEVKQILVIGMLERLGDKMGLSFQTDILLNNNHKE